MVLTFVMKQITKLHLDIYIHRASSILQIVKIVKLP
jgi:hypothetical protein